MAPNRQAADHPTARTVSKSDTAKRRRSRDLDAYFAAAEPLYAALDLETTGLDPECDQITHAAIWDNRGRGHVFSGEEPELLAALDRHIADTPYDTIYTWNGEGFDLNFLRVRAKRHNITTGLRIAPTGEVSKYGTPRWDGHWEHARGRTAHIDIAYRWEPWCDISGVRWKLKPMAEHFGLNPIELDTTDMSQYTDEEITHYVLSDVRCTLILAELWLAGEADISAAA